MEKKSEKGGGFFSNKNQSPIPEKKKIVENQKINESPPKENQKKKENLPYNNPPKDYIPAMDIVGIPKQENINPIQEIIQPNNAFINVSKPNIIQNIINKEDQMLEKIDRNEYDLVVEITSLSSLKESGWKVYYYSGQFKSKAQIQERMSQNNILVGVIGYENVGKTYLLSKLCGNELPSGYSCNTRGLSFKISESENEHIIYADAAGCGKPFEYFTHDIKKQKENDEEDENIKKHIMNETVMTELFIQDYILENCNIILLVLGTLTQDYQKLIERIVNRYSTKKIFLIHNFSNLSEKEYVEKQIERDIIKSFPTKKYPFNNLSAPNENLYYYQQKRRDNIISHLIYARENTNAGRFYNNPTIKFLKISLKAEMKYNPFSFLESFQKFCSKQNFLRYVTLKSDLNSEQLNKLTLTEENNSLKFNKEIDFEVKRGLFTIFGTLEFDNKEDFEPPYKVFEDNKKYTIFVCIPGKIDQKDEIFISEIKDNERFGIRIEGKCNSIFAEFLKDENFKPVEEEGNINGKFVRDIFYCALIDEPNFSEKKITYKQGVFVIEIPKRPPNSGGEKI